MKETMMMTMEITDEGVAEKFAAYLEAKQALIAALSHERPVVKEK